MSGCFVMMTRPEKAEQMGAEKSIRDELNKDVKKVRAKLSRTMTWHYVRLTYRGALLIAATALYIYDRVLGRGTGELDRFVSHRGLLTAIWIIFAAEMVSRMFPSPLESMGCEKQFVKNYRPVEGRTPVLQSWKRTLAVFAAWCGLNGVFGVLYLTGIFDRVIMLLIALTYSVCDLICILFFCPFQTWFMLNKCCTTCRIYNWDYAMMFTPFVFLPGLYTWSLLGLALTVLVLWEVRLHRYPERFSEATNASLACVNCKEKLCVYKKQLRRFQQKQRAALASRLEKILFLALIAAALLLSAARPAYAYERDRSLMAMRALEDNRPIDCTEPLAWMQGRVPWTEGRFLKAGTSSDWVGNGGCSYFAAAFMLLKMGQLDIKNGETPTTVLDKMEAIKGWLTWGKMDFTRINEAYPDVTCEAYKQLFPTADYHEQVQLIREMMKRGYFIILTLDGPHSHGHYVFVDEVLDDDDMVLGDSAYEGTNWYDTHAPAGGYLVDFSMFRCKNLKPANCPSIYKYNMQEFNDPDPEVSEEEAAAQRDKEKAAELSGFGEKETEAEDAESAGDQGDSDAQSGDGSQGEDGLSGDEEVITLDNGTQIVIRVGDVEAPEG